MESRAQGGFDVALGMLRRRWPLAAVLAGLVAAGGLTLVVAMPDVYKATATVLVERQQVPESFVRSTVTSAVDSRLQTISQEVMSRSRLIALIDNFALYTDLRKRLPLEDVVDTMRRHIRVELRGVDQRSPESATVAFTVSYTGGDPKRVAQVTNTLASFYIEEDLKVRERQATGTAEFLKTQIDGIKVRLDEQEKKVSEFKEQYTGELPQQQDANLATLNRLNEQLLLNNKRQVRVKQQRDNFSKELAQSTGASGPDALTRRLSKLHDDLADLRTRFSDKYPDVVAARAEIDRVERELEDVKSGKQTPIAVDPATVQKQASLRNSETELRVLQSEEQNLQRAIALYQGRVENAPRREQEFQGIARDYETTKEMYASLLKRYEEAQLAESLEHRQKGEQFRILDQATIPERPAAPNRMKLLLAVLVASLAVGGAAVLAIEQLDTSFHSLDELRAFTRVPVLVAIPAIVTAASARRGRRVTWLVAASAVASIATVVAGAYFVARGNEQLVGFFL